MSTRIAECAVIAAALTLVGCGGNPGQAGGGRDDAPTGRDAAGLDGSILPDAWSEPSGMRGRVQIANGTLVTDIGTKLRGTYIGIDSLGSPDYSYEQLAAIKSEGGNALHVYAETFSAGPAAGYNLERIDDYVNMTEELGLYCIITIGNGMQNGHFDLQFARDFWGIYAPRYKDETHVIYEVQNEPFAWTSGYGPEAIAMEKEIFDLIRSNAPETHVMMFSYAELGGWSAVQADIDAVNIDWSNASIAWHGYERNAVSITDTFNSIRNAGYASMSTELPAVNDRVADPKMLNMCEKMGSSWIHFVAAQNITDDSYWKDPIDLYVARWRPDFGSWPDITNPNVYFKNKAASFNRQSGVTVEPSAPDGSQAISCSNDDYVAFTDVRFDAGFANFEVSAQGLLGGTIEVRLDGVTGTLMGTCPIAASDGAFMDYECSVAAATGRHELYLVFKGSGAGELFRIDWFKFNVAADSAFQVRKATDYDYQSGVWYESCSDVGGGENINSCDNNDYIAFDNIDFGSGATSLDARVASGANGGAIEVRLDSVTGPIIGTLTVANTGGWQSWVSRTCDISGARGSHDRLFLVFRTDQPGMCNLNTFQFR